MAFLLNSQAQGVSGKMNNLLKHHGAGPPEARGPMQLHRLKAGPEYGNRHYWWPFSVVMRGKFGEKVNGNLTTVLVEW